MDRSDIDVILEARKILWGKDEKMSTQEDFTRLWNLASAEMREKLLAGQASQLVDVGTFSVARWRHGGRVVQSSPAFALSGRLVSKFGVREDRRWGAGGAPRLLTAASLAGASEQGLRGAARCLAALQDALRSCVATGYASLVFPGIGTLLVVRRVARMSFEQDFLDEFESRLKEAGGGAMLMPPSQQSKPPPRRRRRRPPKLVMGPPPSVLARMADAAQSQVSPTDQPPSHGESSPQRRKTKRDPLSALKKQLRATKSGPSAAGRSGGGGRGGTCNLTSCSRHSRHAAKQEPHKVPELPSKQRRREQLEIAEFYRRQEREKVDKEGVMRLYKQDCEERLAKLVREEEAKERRRRTRLRQELQAQREALIASSEQMKTAKKDSDEVLFQFKATRFLTTSVCSG